MTHRTPIRIACALFMTLALVVPVLPFGGRSPFVDPALASHTCTSVTPNSGPVAGGTTVAITGSGFVSGSGGVQLVAFQQPSGGQVGSAGFGPVTAVSDTQIITTSPPAPIG